MQAQIICFTSEVGMGTYTLILTFITFIKVIKGVIKVKYLADEINSEMKILIFILNNKTNARSSNTMQHL